MPVNVDPQPIGCHSVTPPKSVTLALDPSLSVSPVGWFIDLVQSPCYSTRSDIQDLPTATSGY